MARQLLRASGVASYRHEPLLRHPLRNLTPEGGSLGIVTDREELFDVVEKY
jgi:hypothetical protein